MLNVIDAQDDLKMMSDQQLLRKAQEGDPRYPQYLVVAEKQNRDRMRKEIAGRETSDQTVAEQIMYGGIQSQRPPQMAMMPPQMPMMPPQPSAMPPQMPAMPPQAPMMPPQMAQAPQPPMQMMSDGGVVKASNGLFTGSPSLDQRLNPPTYPLLQERPEAIYSQLLEEASMPPFVQGPPELVPTGKMIELPGPTMTRQQRLDRVLEKINRGEMSADQVRNALQNFSKRTGVTTPLEQQALGYFDERMLEQSREATDPDSSELTPMTFDEIVAGATRAETPMPPLGRMVSGAGQLVSTGARNLANRFGGKELAEKIFGPISLQSSDVARSGILSGTQALSSLIEGDEDIGYNQSSDGSISPFEAAAFGPPPYRTAKQNVLDYINERSEDPLGFGKLQDFFDVSDPQAQGNTDVSVQGTGSASLAGADSSANDSFISNLLGGLFKLDSSTRFPATLQQGRDIYRKAAADSIIAPVANNQDSSPSVPVVTSVNKGGAGQGGQNQPPAVIEKEIDEQAGDNQGGGGGGSKGLLSLGDYESIFTKLMDATDKSEFKETPKVDFSDVRKDARGMGIATILGSIGAGIAGGNLSQGLRDATGAVDRLGKRLGDIGMAEKMSDQKATITDITRRESRLDKIRGYSLQIQKLLLDAESADASLASRALSSIPMVMRELTASLQNVNLTDDQRNAIAEDLITYNNQFRTLSSRVTNNFPNFNIVD